MLIYVAFICLIIGAILSYYNMQIIRYDKEKRINEYLDIEINENKNPLSSELYFLSFIPPFNKFIDEFNKEESTAKTKKMILETNSENYRTFRMKQVFSVFIVICLSAFLILTRNTKIGIQNLLLANQETISASLTFNMYLFFSVIMLLITFLYPDIYLKNKKAKQKRKEMDDAPVIQNFIVVLLKSGKTIKEIVYEISQIENCYSKTFKLSYYSFLRSEQEGFEILLTNLNGTLMEDFVKILSTMGEYSKGSSIDSLYSIRQKTIDDILLKKRNKGSFQAVLGQASVLFPLIAVFLLGVYPFINYYMQQAFGDIGMGL